MQRTVIVATLAFSLALEGTLLTPAFAQAPTLASTIEVYVFPREGQTAEQQSKAEAQCYEFATTQTGTDPFAAAKQSEQEKAAAAREAQAAAEASKGAAIKGAARGAARGALIGEIADDSPGEGAAWGAAAGSRRGRRSARRSQQQAANEAKQQVAQAEQKETAAVEGFRKAFSVCLEAKDYMVRF
ncbi:MAG: hypothetical protein AAF184_17835 [Pseudomonadota bacterium]